MKQAMAMILSHKTSRSKAAMFPSCLSTFEGYVTGST